MSIDYFLGDSQEVPQKDLTKQRLKKGLTLVNHGSPPKVGLIRWAKLLAAVLLGDRRNTLCHGVSTSTKISRVWYWSFRWPLAYALWRELRSLPFRILTIHQIGIDRRGVHMGCRKNLGEGVGLSNTGSHCRSVDIQSLRSLFPWSTLLDEEIFLLGRMAGEACPAGKTCTGVHIDLAQATSDKPFLLIEQAAPLEESPCD
jgi:hypothetical protein